MELPLKAVVRGYCGSVMPIIWHNRRFGAAKLKLKEVGSRYFYICAYVWLEKIQPGRLQATQRIVTGVLPIISHQLLLAAACRKDCKR